MNMKTHISSLMVNKMGTPDASNTLHYNFLTILNNDYKKVNFKVDVCLIILVKQKVCTNNTHLPGSRVYCQNSYNLIILIIVFLCEIVLNFNCLITENKVSVFLYLAQLFPLQTLA